MGGENADADGATVGVEPQLPAGKRGIRSQVRGTQQQDAAALPPTIRNGGEKWLGPCLTSSGRPLALRAVSRRYS
jgi:hypothetical protein